MYLVSNRLEVWAGGISALVLLTACASDPRVPDRSAHDAEGLTELIVYTRAGPPNWDIYLYETHGANPRQLTNDPAVDYNPVFSPDGRWIVFTSERDGNADLFALDMDVDRAPIRLTRDSAMDDAASFSPDGECLVFVSSRDGYADIFVMPFSPGDDAAEHRAVNLTRSPGGDFNPAFSPDGQQIAFTRQPSLWEWEGEQAYLHGNVELCVMAADGSDVRSIAAPRAGIPEDIVYTDEVMGSPAWSPDGRFLYYYYVSSYFTEGADGVEQEVAGGPELRRVAIDGSGDVSIAANAYSPAIVPGGRIAFVRPDANDGPPFLTTGQVHSVAVHGTDERAESAGVTNCFAPDFDRGSGRMVCFGEGPVDDRVLVNGKPFLPPGGVSTAFLPDRTVQLRGIRGNFPAVTDRGEVLSTISGISRAVNADLSHVALQLSALDGSNAREFFTPPTGVAWDPTVSEDGECVVLTVGQPFGAPDENVDLWKVNLDGSNAVNLGTGLAVNMAMPSISKDGMRMAFRAPATAPGEAGESDFAIFVMDLQSEAVRQLTDGEQRATAPAISPDGERVAYVVFSDLGAKIWIQRIDDDQPRLLEPAQADVPGIAMHPTFSPDGRWVVFTSDRGGMNDEWPLTINFQPYGDLWAVPVRGGAAGRLTNNKWEDGLADWDD